MNNFNNTFDLSDYKTSFQYDIDLRGAEKAAVFAADAILANAEAIVKESESLSKDDVGRLVDFYPLFREFIYSTAEKDPRISSPSKFSDYEVDHILDLLYHHYAIVVLLYSLRVYEGFVETTVCEPYDTLQEKSIMRRKDGILPGGSRVVSSLSLFTDTFISMLFFLSELLNHCGEDCLMSHIRDAYNELQFSEEVDFEHFKSLAELIDSGIPLYCPLPNPFKFLLIDLYRQFTYEYEEHYTSSLVNLFLSESARRSYAVLLDEYVNSCFKEARNIRANIITGTESININKYSK